MNILEKVQLVFTSHSVLLFYILADFFTAHVNFSRRINRYVSRLSFPGILETGECNRFIPRGSKKGDDNI